MSDFTIERSRSTKNHLKHAGYILAIVFMLVVFIVILSYLNIVYITDTTMHLVILFVMVAIPILIRVLNKRSRDLFVPAHTDLLSDKQKLRLMQIGGDIYSIPLSSIEYMFTGTKKDIKNSDMIYKYPELEDNILANTSYFTSGSGYCIVITKSGEIGIFPRDLGRMPIPFKRNDIFMKTASQQAGIPYENRIVYIDNIPKYKKVIFLVFVSIFVALIFYFGIE